MTTPRIAVIVASTRTDRFGGKPADWLWSKLPERRDMTFELIDLRDHPLPFFDEAATNAFVETKDPAARAWQDLIRRFDGYIFVTPEYNHSIPGALKNALDQAYVEWKHKPIAALAYGSMGGARALEHLRQISVELQMVAVRNAVHIGGPDFHRVSPIGDDDPISAIEEHIAPSLEAMLDDVAWWARATMAARSQERKEAA
jgi:NAD(P)H-dependent FMN reductase